MDDGSEHVSVTVQRLIYTDKSVVSAIRVTNKTTGARFSGYTLEDVHAGDKGNKPPIPPGTYHAFTRADGPKGWRLELRAVPGYSHIEIHVGNFVKDVEGCFAVGTSRGNDAVWSSREAMQQMHDVVGDAKRLDIVVTVIGPQRKP